MKDSLTDLIVDEFGRFLPRNQIIEDVCVRGSLKWPEAELLVALVEAEQAHTIVRRQGPWLIAISILLILIGSVPYVLLIYFGGAVAGLFPPPALPSGVEVSIPNPVSAQGLGECVASFGLLSGGIVGLFRTLRRYRET